MVREAKCLGIQITTLQNVKVKETRNGRYVITKGGEGLALMGFGIRDGTQLDFGNGRSVRLEVRKGTVLCWTVSGRSQKDSSRFCTFVSFVEST